MFIIVRPKSKDGYCQDVAEKWVHEFVDNKGRKRWNWKDTCTSIEEAEEVIQKGHWDDAKIFQQVGYARKQPPSVVRVNT
jgi:hypothetical protein